MELFKESHYKGLYYSLNQLGIHLYKMPLYRDHPKSLEYCMKNACWEFDNVKKHCQIQNIQDGAERLFIINQAISKDVNESPFYQINGERTIVELENGIKNFHFKETLDIIE
ncbi:hypothetical protein BBFL7_00856 [Flavobacteria bacterium BBFL7]|nr:hypothetical protein BBFL7_00856 [Flavobacteria bacterium BBFL7]